MLLATVLGLSLMAQDKLPGSDRSLEVAVEESKAIVVAELETYTLIVGSGAVAAMTGARFKDLEVLKGGLKVGEMTGLAISAVGPERLPKKGEVCIYFMDDFGKRLKAVKLLAKTEKNIRSVKEAVGSGKKP